MRWRSSPTSRIFTAAPAGTGRRWPRPRLSDRVKVAVVDATGRSWTHVRSFRISHETGRGQGRPRGARCPSRVQLIAIGGTASRETDALAADSSPRFRRPAPLRPRGHGERDGSVQSASAYAAQELPTSTSPSVARCRSRAGSRPARGTGEDRAQVDRRRAVSARRRRALARSLDAVVEDAVNAVGVDLNCLRPLLSRVGVTESLATAIVAHREKSGRFASRRRCSTFAPRPKAFRAVLPIPADQRWRDPLDASVCTRGLPGRAPHPGSFRVTLAELIGDERSLRSLRPAASPTTDSASRR